jgi:hypothetical protein
MAWVFSLSAECEREADATALAAHFAGDPTSVAGSGGGWWCIVMPAGVRHDDEAAQREHAPRLYERLRSAPPRYRYALAGVEVDEFRSYSELLDEDRALAPGFPGLVLAEPLWKRLGEPAGFEAFSPGYVWAPTAPPRAG